MEDFGELLIVTTAALSQIEAQFAQLPREDQQALLLRLRDKMAPTLPADWAADIAAMARDPDIQREIREIEREFSVAENDGLKEV